MMQAIFTLLCACAFATLSVDAANSVSATFTPQNSDGVSGVIRFVEQGLDLPLSIEISLNGEKIVTTGGAMHVHEMWTGTAMDGMGDMCSLANTGGHYNPTNAVGGNVSPYEAGDLTNKFSYSLADRSQASVVFNDTEAFIAPLTELIGKSIVIHSKADASRWICAKIVNDPPNKQYVAVATFSGDNTDGVKGLFRFVQTGLEPMQIEYNLIGLKNKAAGFHVHQYGYNMDPVTMDGKYATCEGPNTGAHYNPTGVPSPHIPGTDYESGDLSGKFDPLSGETATMVVQDLPAHLRVADIIGRSIVIHTGLERWVCAKIMYLDMETTVSATATFSGARTNGIQGTISFSQKGLEPPLVTVALNNLKNMTGGYHVHMTPVTPGQTQDKNEGCSAAVTGGHWNPTVVLPADAPLRYEAGDLSGKFGSLANQFSIAMTYLDKADHMRLADIVGRSVVIHDADGARYACANIMLDDPSQRDVAIVDFDYDGLTGYIRFSQLGTQPAQISVNLKALQQRAGQVHVHMSHLQNAKPSGGGAECSAEATGGHWNPTGWSLGTPGYEAGDLTGKMGKVLDSLDKIEEIMTDSTALLRVRDIIGRSVVVHKKDGSRWACGTIRRENPNTKYVATAVFSPANSGGVSGLIRFVQDGQNQPAQVQVRLRGLASKAGGWHVHEKSLVNNIPSGMGAACAATATGGHFNPSKKVAPFTDGYEEGDLSAKFESLAGKDYLYMDYTDVDSKMSVFDITGKSIVIHSADGERWVCATIQADVAVSVTASFDGASTDGVRGTIQLTQTPGEKAWITTNLLGLNSMAQGWHVHENALANDAVGGTDCAVEAIGGHYNPTGVVAGEGSDKEAGDLSAKFRTFADKKEALMYEEDSPALMDVAAIVGKSVLIHKVNGDRWICATFRMDDASDTVTASASWVGVSEGGLTAPMNGRVTFSQKGMEPARIGWKFSGLSSLAQKWHIHKLPVPDGGHTACSADDVQGHWDPSNAAGLTTRKEWGDLSGKFAELSGDTAEDNAEDVADFMNVKALFGKSIVLHSPDGSRWLCANIIVDGVAPYDPTLSGGGGNGSDPDCTDPLNCNSRSTGAASTLASSLVAIVVGVATVLLTAF